MKVFRFSLEKALEWYSRQYELEERRLHECLSALHNAERALVELDAERLSVEREVISHQSIPARELAALGLYRLGVKKREADLKDLRLRCESEVEAQRARLQAAQRKVRLVEKLRERRVAEHVYEETRELEELASDAFFAKWAR